MKRIVIISSHTDTYTNPTLLSFFKIAEEKKIKIFLISPTPVYIDKRYTNIKHIFFPVGYFVAFIMLFGFLSDFSFFLFSSYLKIFYFRKKNPVLGIDKCGFIVGNGLKKNNLCSTLTYVSFEILFRDECNSYLDRKIKNLEILSFSKADFLIIQDTLREELFLKQMDKIPADLKIYNIPVSPFYSQRIKAYPRKENNGKIKLNYSGTLARALGTDDLLKCIQSNKWDENYAIEIHSRFSKNNEYFQKIDNLTKNGKPVLLHNEPFNFYEDYMIYLSEFDIGLVLYKPDFNYHSSGKNIRNIGLASGKFSTYLMLGIPVIVTWDKTLESLNYKYSYGKIINDISEIPNAVKSIYEDYKNYQEGALMCYKEVLDPTSKINLFLDENILH